MKRLRSAILVVTVAAAGLAVPGVALAHRRIVHVGPRAFASCARLVGYERSHFSVTRGLPEPSPRPLSEPAIGAPVSNAVATPQVAGAQQGAGEGSFSTTNNQEPGVEEPDIVKTDGSTVFAVEQGTLFALAAGGPAPHILGSLSLGATGSGSQLLLQGSRLLVISASQVLPVAVGIGVGVAVPAIAPSPYYYPATTTIKEVNVSDPAAMSVARTMSIEGTFVDARQSGSTARLVISSAPRAIATPALRASVAGWVPRRRFRSFITGHRYTRAVAACGAVRRPAQFSGTGILSIVTINMDRGLYATDSTALAADAQVVYGSLGSLYVATQRWFDPGTAAGKLPGSLETVIDKFDATDPEHTPLVASGAVPGYLLNQFSMSEYQGDLRVASTSQPIWWTGSAPASSQSYVTVLADHGGTLSQVGQVAGLGAGQQIYSVRFIGASGYVVTFRRVDPLYTIDLSTPSAPRVAGQLELEGYSAYLHPVGDGLLLGVGQEVGPDNEPSGAQLELFDVSNPAAPRLQAHASLGEGSSSQVQYDHHAFLFWPATGLAVLPLSIYPAIGGAVPPVPVPVPLSGGGSSAAQPAAGFVGAVGFLISRSGISELGRISHDPIEGSSPQIDRSVVIGGELFTLSREGMMASSLNTLARLAFVKFPSLPPPVAGEGGRSSPGSPPH
jgi:hypothetical protein